MSLHVFQNDSGFCQNEPDGVGDPERGGVAVAAGAEAADLHLRVAAETRPNPDGLGRLQRLQPGEKDVLMNQKCSKGFWKID